MAHVYCPECGEKIPRNVKCCPKCAMKKDIRQELDQILKNPDISIKALYKIHEPKKQKKKASAVVPIICIVYIIILTITCIIVTKGIRFFPEGMLTSAESIGTAEGQEYTLAGFNALLDAKAQIGYGAGHSRSGLITWLEEKGYSEEAAIYAADNCGADWSAEAVKHLKRVLDWGPHYNESEAANALRDQGFTDVEISKAISEIYEIGKTNSHS